MALIGSTNEQKIWNYLKAKGLNYYGISGLMGNLYAESALNPQNLQNTYEKKLGYTDATYTLAVDNGTYTNFVKDSAGYGLAQWTFWSRKQNLLNYAKCVGKSIGDLEMQLDFMWKELSEGYTDSVLAVLKTATSVLQASNAVLLKYERPADQSIYVQNKRASYGQKYFDKYAGTASSNSTSSTSVSIGGNGKMKYNENNKPLVCMQTNSTCYKNTSKMTVRGVLWHSTGANNPNLKRYIQPGNNAPDRDEWLKLLGKNAYGNDWNHINNQAGLNCWIGKLADGTVTTVQTMPWNYKPWGCGSGSKGSCNNTHVQFEICEDSLNNRDYFEKVYKEACELTAYICKMYNINPKGTFIYNGVTVPTILCHKDSANIGLGSNHGDVLHWFKKYGKTMDDVRNDVAILMGKNDNIAPSPVPEQKPSTTLFAIGDEVKLISGAKYTSGVSIPNWIIKSVLYVREIRNNGYIVISTLKSGAVTGVVNPKYLTKNKQTVSEDASSNTTTVTTPTKPDTVNLSVGNKVKLVSGAKYTNGSNIPSWVFNNTLYVRDIRANGDVVISTVKTGAVTGVVESKYLTKDGKPVASTTTTPIVNTATKFSVGDAVRLVSGAKYTSGNSIPSWVFDKTLYVRQLKNDYAVISTLKSGAVTGAVALKYLIKK